MRAKCVKLEDYDLQQEDKVGPFFKELVDTLQYSEEQFGKAWIDDLRDIALHPSNSPKSIAVKRARIIVGVDVENSRLRANDNDDDDDGDDDDDDDDVNFPPKLVSQMDGGRFETAEETEIADLMVFPYGFPAPPSPKGGENSSLPKSSSPGDDNNDEDVECERLKPLFSLIISVKKLFPPFRYIESFRLAPSIGRIRLQISTLFFVMIP